jgi:hypothetical protein
MDPRDTTEQPPATTRSVRGEGPPLRRRLLVAGAVGLPVLVFVLWWFQPQALLFDDVVDESFPIGSADRNDEGRVRAVSQWSGRARHQVVRAT